MAVLDDETRNLIERLAGLIMDAMNDRNLIFFEGCQVYTAPTGVPPEYIDVMVDGIRDVNVLWRGVPRTLAVGDDVLVWENPVTHRREIIGGSGTTGTSGIVSPAQLLTVGPTVSAGNAGDGESEYTTVAAALAAIVDAAAAKPYVIFLEPGVTTEAGDLTWKSDVYLVGHGPEASILDLGANSILVSSDRCGFYNCTVRSSDISYAFRLFGGATDIFFWHVNIEQSGAGDCLSAEGAATTYRAEHVRCLRSASGIGFQFLNTAIGTLIDCEANDTTNISRGLQSVGSGASVTTQSCIFHGATDDVQISASDSWNSYKDQVDPGNCTLTGTVSMLDLNAGDSFAFTVKNTSGATRTHGDVGYIDEAGEFKTTATAYNNVSWAVVVIGGANNADMWVTRRGRVTVTLNGNCAIGDYLYTSSTAAQAQPQSYVRPEVLGVALTANAAGAGGTCEALLLCHRKHVDVTSTSEILRQTGVTFSSWLTTIAAVAGAVVTYNGAPGPPFVGNEDSIVPNYAVTPAHLCKLVLHNTTRGDYALIDIVNTAANTITLTAAAPGAWAVGDNIQVNSLTCVVGAAPFYFDLEIVSAEIPPLAVSLTIYHGLIDTGGSGFLYFHPYNAWSISEELVVGNPAANVADFLVAPASINQRRFCIKSAGTGAATIAPCFWRMVGYSVATP